MIVMPDIEPSQGRIIGKRNENGPITVGFFDYSVCTSYLTPGSVCDFLGRFPNLEHTKLSPFKDKKPSPQMRRRAVSPCRAAA